MKKIVFKGLLALSTLIIINSCNSITIKTNGSTDEMVAENTATVDMEVEGMVCAMGCAKYIEEKVADLDGVVLSEVDFEEGTAHFEFDKSSISSDDIQEYINSIHEGQYQATISKEEENDEGGVSEEYSSVSEKVNISFPELFTYFIKRIK